MVLDPIFQTFQDKPIFLFLRGSQNSDFNELSKVFHTSCISDLTHTLQLLDNGKLFIWMLKVLVFSSDLKDEGWVSFLTFSRIHSNGSQNQLKTNKISLL